MSKSKTSKTETVEQIAKRTGKTVEQVKQALKFKETLAQKEAAAIAKYGPGSGRINRQTGEVEEIDIVPGSIKFEPNASGQGGKFTVEVKCVDCGEIRRLATSDLFQVARCEEHQKEHKAALRKAKRSSGASNAAATAALLDEIGG